MSEATTYDVTRKVQAGSRVCESRGVVHDPGFRRAGGAGSFGPETLAGPVRGRPAARARLAVGLALALAACSPGLVEGLSPDGTTDAGAAWDRMLRLDGLVSVDGGPGPRDAQGLPDAAPRPDAAPPPDAAPRPDAAPPPDASPVDASSDPVERVCSRWASDRADLREGTWTGDVQTCDPGDFLSPGRENALRLVNLYRWLAGLPPASLDPTRNAKAQACALMMHANGRLSHNPPSTWTCYTQDGAQAAGSSNIASGPGVSAVDMYMADWGNADTMGHRRWILSNSLGAIGIGSTSSYSCMWVIGTGGSANAQWTAWPPAGIVPYALFSVHQVDRYGWTIQSDAIALSNATVTVSANGQDLTVTVSNLLSGYGSWYAIRIVPDGWTTQPDTTYHVTVTGVNPTIEYDVQVVSCP